MEGYTPKPENLAEKIELLITYDKGYYDGRFAYERRLHHQDILYHQDKKVEKNRLIGFAPDNPTLNAQIQRFREEQVLDLYLARQKK
ncbi:MAG: hypothetical protein ACMXYL_03445 [Candidatus Woesearchaeota archaeon]